MGVAFFATKSDFDLIERSGVLDLGDRRRCVGDGIRDEGVMSHMDSLMLTSVFGVPGEIKLDSRVSMLAGYIRATDIDWHIGKDRFLDDFGMNFSRKAS